jgi:hypothetical protein
MTTVHHPAIRTRRSRPLATLLLLTSDGGNTFGDATCNPGPDDVVEP